jgi:hypothetical protein
MYSSFLRETIKILPCYQLPTITLHVQYRTVVLNRSIVLMLILLEMYVCYTDVAALFIIFLFFHPFFPVRLIYMVGTRILLYLAGNRTGLPFVFLFFILINLFDVCLFFSLPYLSFLYLGVRHMHGRF